MPASSSCTSSRSTGTFRTSANWATVTSAICIRTSYSTVLFGALEPMGAGSHDQLAGTLSIQPLDILELVSRLIGQLLTRLDTPTRQRERQAAIHAVERQKILGWLGLIQFLFLDDG